MSTIEDLWWLVVPLDTTNSQLKDVKDAGFLNKSLVILWKRFQNKLKIKKEIKLF